MRHESQRNICFVTGTRAEFGLMRTVLRAIDGHPRLKLQLIVTGMHLDARLGQSIDAIRQDGWTIDAIVPWDGGDGGAAETAAAMGSAVSGIAKALEKLRSDVVLVVGDRVEAFAAAAAGQVSQKTVAHVHGGDRAQGQIDDALRHAITKLAHVHFPATAESARRIRRLGEEPSRVHCVGAPGVDHLADAAMTFASLARQYSGLRRRRYALLVLHPTDANPALEFRRARDTLAATRAAGCEHVVIVAPNNDPGAEGILRAWNQAAGDDRVTVRPNVARAAFLGLMRDAAVLVGNSSSGIIEAASFQTPVVNIGPRQQGRERSGNVIDVAHKADAIRRAVARVWNGGRPKRWRGRNVYGGSGAGRRIAAILGRIAASEAPRRKLITY
jgi:UDP-hydrolysing UDP-N-acetyl-D-glucosamine 2-epimerase